MLETNINDKGSDAPILLRQIILYACCQLSNG